MRLPFPLRLQNRRGLLVYQLVLILIAIIVLILVLLYVARRNQASAPAEAADRTATNETVELVAFTPNGEIGTSLQHRSTSSGRSV